ncbi:MAG: sulfotransferase, partial [Ilumatobacteraceae bacterium]
WVLKSPPHLLDLDALLSVYPDARLVQTHRDPFRIMASLSNLVYTIRKLGAPDTDPHDLARSVIELWGTVAARGAAARTDRSVDERVLDIAYRDLVGDPTAAVRTIYDHFGIDFTDEFAARLKAFLAADAAEDRAPHRYDGTKFGIERAHVEAAFSGYYDAYRGVCAE